MSQWSPRRWDLLALSDGSIHNRGMSISELVEARTSTRTFSDAPIPLDDVRELVRLATLAPNVANAQPWRFVAVANRELLGEIADAVETSLRAMLPDPQSPDGSRALERVVYHSSFFRSAPVVIFVGMMPYEAVADSVSRDPGFHRQLNELRVYPDVQSIGAAVQTLLLAAVDKGYGSCWLSGPTVARDAIEPLIGLDPPAQLAATIALGKTQAHDTPTHNRLPLDEVYKLIP